MLKWDVISKAITCLILCDGTTSVMVQKRKEEMVMMMQQREGGEYEGGAG